MQKKHPTKIEKSINSGKDNENATSTTQIGNNGDIVQTINSDANTEGKTDDARYEVTSTC